MTITVTLAALTLNYFLLVLKCFATETRHSNMAQPCIKLMNKKLEAIIGILEWGLRMGVGWGQTSVYYNNPVKGPLHRPNLPDRTPAPSNVISASLDRTARPYSPYRVPCRAWYRPIALYALIALCSATATGLKRTNPRLQATCTKLVPVRESYGPQMTQKSY